MAKLPRLDEIAQLSPLVVRVLGLFGFGRLYLLGVRLRLPSLPYLLCAATQLVAAGLAVALPAAWWRQATATAKATESRSAEPVNQKVAVMNSRRTSARIAQCRCLTT